jgi:hypothetical protein
MAYDGSKPASFVELQSAQDFEQSIKMGGFDLIDVTCQKLIGSSLHIYYSNACSTRQLGEFAIDLLP